MSFPIKTSNHVRIHRIEGFWRRRFRTSTPQCLQTLWKFTSMRESRYQGPANHIPYPVSSHTQVSLQ